MNIPETQKEDKHNRKNTSQKTKKYRG